MDKKSLQMTWASRDTMESPGVCRKAPMWIKHAQHFSSTFDEILMDRLTILPLASTVGGVGDEVRSTSRGAGPTIVIASNTLL